MILTSSCYGLNVFMFWFSHTHVVGCWLVFMAARWILMTMSSELDNMSFHTFIWFRRTFFFYVFFFGQNRANIFLLEVTDTICCRLQCKVIVTSLFAILKIGKFIHTLQSATPQWWIPSIGHHGKRRFTCHYSPKWHSRSHWHSWFAMALKVLKALHGTNGSEGFNCGKSTCWQRLTDPI